MEEPVLEGNPHPATPLPAACLDLGSAPALPTCAAGWRVGARSAAVSKGRLLPIASNAQCADESRDMSPLFLSWRVPERALGGPAQRAPSPQRSRDPRGHRGQAPPPAEPLGLGMRSGLPGQDMRRGRTACGRVSWAEHAHGLLPDPPIGAGRRGGRPGAAPGRAPSTCEKSPRREGAPRTPHTSPRGQPVRGPCSACLPHAATRFSPFLPRRSCPSSGPHPCFLQALSGTRLIF